MKILIVEDSLSLREVLCTVLQKEGYDVTSIDNAEDAIKICNKNIFQIIISDFKLPGQNGLDLLTTLRNKGDATPFIMMTAYGTIDIAIQAMKNGATDFLLKPFEPFGLIAAVDEIIKHNRIINREPDIKNKEIITNDSNFKEILRQCDKVAKVESSVMILGESGTGKELVAHRIHLNGLHHSGPFIAINCGAVPRELLESELFGHEAGAFTGATQTRIGLFEVAQNGTIFLDEIADMPPELQVKLLRVLQEKEIKKVGSNRSIKVNCRVISATNKNVDPTNGSSTLRADLFYRLSVISFVLPPLRERHSDIELLAHHFIKVGAEKNKTPLLEISNEALEALKSYQWPGNIRELENVIERASILAKDEIKKSDLGLSTNMGIDLDILENITITLPELAQQVTQDAEMKLIFNTLTRTHGNKTKSAEILGISYKTLLNKIKNYKINYYC